MDNAIALEIDKLLSEPIDTASEEILAAWLLATLPSEIKTNTTLDQKRYWARLRVFNGYASACWIALTNGKDPLEQWKYGTKPDKLLYEIIWGRVYEVQSLLNLLRHTYKDILKTLQLLYPDQFAYETAFDLFTEIVSCEENSFLQDHLKPYWRFSLEEAKKNHDLLRKSPKAVLTKPQVKRLTQLVKQQPQNFLREFSLAVCQVKAKKDPLVANLLKTYRDKVMFSHDVARRACTEASKGKLPDLYSYEVRNGNEHRANRYGGGYS